MNDFKNDRRHRFLQVSRSASKKHHNVVSFAKGGPGKEAIMFRIWMMLIVVFVCTVAVPNLQAMAVGADAIAQNILKDTGVCGGVVVQFRQEI
jgi:hypothetical protein